MIRTINEVYESLKKVEPKVVAVAQAADGHVLEAVSEAFKEGLITPVLVGNKEKIKSVASENDIDVSNFKIHHTEDEKDAALEAVKLVSSGSADILMKGLLESPDFLKAVLNKEHGIKKTDYVISAIAAIELKKLNKFVFITDPGFTPAPDLDMKIKLVKNAVDVVRKFGIETPNVAMLSASETVNQKMVSSLEAKQIEEMNKNGEIGNCLIAGPISFDLALSEEAACQKSYENPVGGKADILVVPTLEVGNILYKALSMFADMETGGIMWGAKAPIIFTSRADSAATKKNTIALAVFLAQQEDEE